MGCNNSNDDDDDVVVLFGSGGIGTTQLLVECVETLKRQVSAHARHVINPATRTVTVEVESSYNNDSGWLGFGFTNKPKMVGSKAVIGLPRRRRGGTVRVYVLSMATVGRRCDGSRRRPAC
jgi:hypothetical protein